MRFGFYNFPKQETDALLTYSAITTGSTKRETDAKLIRPYRFAINTNWRLTRILFKGRYVNSIHGLLASCIGAFYRFVVSVQLSNASYWVTEPHTSKPTTQGWRMWLQVVACQTCMGLNDWLCANSLVCLLLFYILAISKVISGHIPSCDNAHAWWPYSATPLGDQANHSITLSWHWANQPLLYSNNAEHLARKQLAYILKSLVWLDRGSNP